MGNEREKREPTNAEVALWGRIVDGMMLSEGPLEVLSCPKAAFRAWVLTVIMQYTDWLRPEPTADDREAAEKIANEWTDTCPSMLAAEIAAALSAVRGNRAELEAAAREARDSIRKAIDLRRSGGESLAVCADEEMRRTRNILNAALLEGVKYNG